MKTMLVTGGAGFIGSHLCDVLLALGHNVIALDSLYLGRMENISLAEKNQNFKFIKADILDNIALEKVFNDHKFDTVFHLAANSDIKRSSSDTSADLKLTFMTTFRVLNVMRTHGVRKIVFSSTSSIYGQTEGKSVAEDDGPLLPVSHYGAGKLASEGFIASFVENYGFEAWITRFPNVCGERTTHGVIHDFIAKLRVDSSELEVLGDGTQAKPYLYVKDLITAMLFVYDNTNDRINVFNIGTEGQTRVSDIARMVIDSMRLSAKIRYAGGDRGWIGDVPKFAYNLDKIHSLGWRATNSSDQAVQQAINAILSEEMTK
jgi:UDP-glucose 4-epimerase